jgi:hypothetical protein
LIQHNIFVAVSQNSYIVSVNVWVHRNVVMKDQNCFHGVKVEKFVIVQKWKFDEGRNSVVNYNCGCACMIDVTVNGVTCFQVSFGNESN